MSNTDQDSLKGFKEKLTSLMTSLDSRIETLSEMISFQNGSAPTDKVETVNSLKFHRYKIKERLEDLGNAEQKYWEENRSFFKDEFLEAKQLLS